MRHPSIAILAASAFLAGNATAYTTPDAWITAEIRTKLIAVEGIPGTTIHVDTLDGRVTLMGTVPTNRLVGSVLEIATEAGAQSVHNLLEVVAREGGALSISDASIQGELSLALAEDVALGGSAMSVQSVRGGVVILSGRARTLSDHVRALEHAGRVDGVRRVVSEIRSPSRFADIEVWGDGSRSSSEDVHVTSAVKLALLTNTETLGFDINVDTARGVVTLYGVVPSARVKENAETEAAQVDGVKSVVNALHVVLPAQSAVQDSHVEDNVRTRLAANTQLSAFTLGVEVKSGIVHVSGSVRNQVDRLTVLTVLRTTRGVRGVVDWVTLSPTRVALRRVVSAG